MVGLTESTMRDCFNISNSIYYIYPIKLRMSLNNKQLNNKHKQIQLKQKRTHKNY